jgi:cytochrome c oxidase assembly factor CtaG
VWEALTPHTDQHLGGLIMWVPGGLVFLIAISVVFFRWQAAGGDDIAVASAGASHGR